MSGCVYTRVCSETGQRNVISRSENLRLSSLIASAIISDVELAAQSVTDTNSREDNTACHGLSVADPGLTTPSKYDNMLQLIPCLNQSDTASTRSGRSKTRETMTTATPP